MSENRYVELASVNVNEHIEKKGNLSYLSWAWAVDQLLRRDPFASWTYGEPKMYGDTMMVFCTVNAFGLERTMQLPVMDFKNKSVANPDSFAVNTAMQRCLVKAIALHGLGLYIYAGEDLPDGEEAPKPITGAQVSQDEFAALQPEAQQVVREWALEVIALCEDGQPGSAVAFVANVCESRIAMSAKISL